MEYWREIGYETLTTFLGAKQREKRFRADFLLIYGLLPNWLKCYIYK